MLVPSNWRLRLHQIGRDILAMLFALRDPRVSWLAKAVAILPVVYLIMPVDLIPDMLPIVGWVDDLLMLPLAGKFFSRIVPSAVMAELPAKADRKLLRWGPRVIWGVATFLLFWVMLAGLGGWYFYRSFHERMETSPPPKPAYSEHLFK